MTTSLLPPSNLTQQLFPQLLTASTSALRLDSRTSSAPLTPSVAYSPTQRGTATLTLSHPASPAVKTIILSSVHAELVPPRQERPYEGQVQIHLNTALAQGTSSAARSNPSAEASTAELERQLDLALRRSGLIDREALCLKAGEAVWNISINVSCLSLRAGNALQGCILASTLALMDYVRPDAAVEEGGEIKIFDEGERVGVKLPITGGLVGVEAAVFLPPVPTSAGGGSGGTMSSSAADGEAPSLDPILLLDPTPLEVTLSSALLTYVLTPNTGQFLLAEKIGRAPLDVDVMLRGMKVVEARARGLGKWVDESKKQRDEQVGKEVN